MTSLRYVSYVSYVGSVTSLTFLALRALRWMETPLNSNNNVITLSDIVRFRKFFQKRDTDISQGSAS